MSKLRQNRHPERSASPIYRVTQRLVARSRRACPERSRRNLGGAYFTHAVRSFSTTEPAPGRGRHGLSLGPRTKNLLARVQRSCCRPSVVEKLIHSAKHRIRGNEYWNPTRNDRRGARHRAPSARACSHCRNRRNQTIADTSNSTVRHRVDRRSILAALCGRIPQICCLQIPRRLEVSLYGSRKVVTPGGSKLVGAGWVRLWVFRPNLGQGFSFRAYDLALLVAVLISMKLFRLRSEKHPNE